MACAAWRPGSPLRRRENSDRPLEVETEAGIKVLTLLECAGGRFTFRAAMGEPERIALETIDVAGDLIQAVTLRVGNPQCVVLGEVTVERLTSIAARLAVHPRFEEGTNVELATRRGARSGPDPHLGARCRPDRGVRHRRVRGGRGGDALRRRGARRAGRVAGRRRSAWSGRADGLFLTGWAEIIAEVTWLAAGSARA